MSAASRARWHNRILSRPGASSGSTAAQDNTVGRRLIRSAIPAVEKTESQGSGAMLGRRR